MSVTGGFAGAGSAGSIDISVVATDLTRQGLASAEANLAAFEGRIGSFINRLSAMSAQSAGLMAIGGAFAVAAKQAAQVEQNVANLNAALRATPQQLQAIRQVGLDLSRLTQFTDAQILQSQRALAKAGTSPQVLADRGFNQNITNLASATFSEPVQAAQLYIAATKEFRTGTSDAKATVDTLAQAIDSSVGDANDFAVAFKQLGPVANAAGESLRDTASAVADLQNAGLRGDTGTALKTFLLRLEAPTAAARREIDALGLSLYTAGGQLKTYGEIADEIRLKTAGMTDEQRNAAGSKIFGTRGVRVFDIFAEEGGQGIRDTEQHMAGIGSASDIAAEKLNTLEGSVKKLSSSLNVLAVQGGQSLIPTLRGMTDALTGAVNAASSANQAIGGAGGNALFSGLAITGEVLVSRQISKVIDARRSQAAAPGEKAASQAAKQAAAEQAAIQTQQDTAWQKSIAASQAAEEKKLAEQQEAATKAGALQQEAADRAFAQQEAANAKQEAAWAASRAKIEVIEAEHQAKMAALAAEGQAKIATLASKAQSDVIAAERMHGGISGSGGPAIQAIQQQSTAAIVAEEERVQAALARQQAARQSAIGRVPGAQLGPAIPPWMAANQAAAGINVPGVTASGAFIGPLPSMVPGGIQPFIGPQTSMLAGGFVAPTIAAPAPGTLQKLKTGAGSAMASAGAAIGEVALPLTIALTVKQMIVDPAIEGLARKRAAAAAGQIDMSQYGADPKQVQQQAEADLNKYQNALQAAQQRGIGMPARIIGAFSPWVAGKYFEDRTKGEVDNLKQNVADAQAQLDQAKQAQSTTPGKFVSDQTTRIQDLNQQIAAGKMTADQAMASFRLITEEGADPYATSLIDISDAALKAGVTQKQLNELLDAASQSYKQTAEDTRQQAILDLQTEQNKKQQIADLRRIGVPEAAIQSVVNDTGDPAELVNNRAIVKSYQDRDKAAQDFADQEAARQKQAQSTYDSTLRSVQQSAGSATKNIDLSQGVESLVKAAPELTKVRSELAALGQTDVHLDAISAMADRFKGVADAETEAERELQAYFLTLSQSDKYLGQVGQLQKVLEDAVEAAAKARMMGNATPEQEKLLTNAPGYFGQLATQNQGLQANRAGNINAMFAGGVPDFTGLDSQFQSTLGGPTGAKQLTIDVNDNIKDIQKALDDMTLKDYLVTVKAVLQPPGEAVQVPPFSPTDPGAEDPTRGYGGGGGSALGFHALSQSQYGQIVTSGPLANPSAYAQIVKAAQDAGVDPRLLLATLKYENSYGTNVSAANLAGNNLGGIKFANQPGASEGSVSPENDHYASFDSLESFFKAMAGNLTTGIYQKPFEAGDIKTIFKDYVVGPNAAGSDDQWTNINSRTAYFNSLTAQFPGGDNPVGTGALAGAANLPNAVPNLRNQIVNQALKSVDMDKLAGYCETFVEETVQAITGRRGATGKREDTAASALADAQGMGLEVSKAQAKPGDLVYYGASGSSPVGHVAIYMGAGQQISTADAGGQKIHVEGVGSGAHYIKTPGLPDDASGGFTQPGSPAAGALAAATAVNTMANYGKVLWDATDASKQLVANLNSLRADQIGQFTSGLNTFVDSMTKFKDIDTKTAQGGFISQSQQLQNASDAMKEGAAFGAVWASTLSQISRGAGVTADNIAAISATAGPLAPIFINEAKAMADIEQHSQNVVTIQESIKNLQADQASTQRARQVDDRNRSRSQQDTQYAEQQSDAYRQRSQTMTQRGWQDQDRRWQVQQRQMQLTAQQQDHDDSVAEKAENDRYQTVTRHEEDIQRQIAFDGGERKRQLVEAAQAIDDQHRTTTEGMQSTGRIFVGRGKVAGTEAEALSNASQAAAIDDARRKADDLYKRQKEANQLLQDQADKDQTKILYDLETERIAESRKHEDTLKGITDEADRRHWADQQAADGIQAAIDAEGQRRLMIQRGWEDDQFNIQMNRQERQHSWDMEQRQIEDQRVQEDEIARLKLEQYQSDLADEQNAVKSAQDQLTYTQQMVPLFQQMYEYAGKSADALLSAYTDFTGNPGKEKTAASPSGKAGGTSNFAGGWTTMNELGGELAFLPSGSAIIPADKTDSILSLVGKGGGSSGGKLTVIHEAPVTINLDGSGLQFTADEAKQIKAIISKAKQRQGVGATAQSAGRLKKTG